MTDIPKSDPKMMTRSRRLSPNGNKLWTEQKNDEIQDEQSNKLIAKRDNVRNQMKAQFTEQEEITIPNLEKDYNNKKISFEKYDEEMDKLNKTITDLQETMNGIEGAIKNQNEYMQNMSIEVSLQNQENKETFENIEKDSLLNSKETLNARRIANDNQQDIRNIKRTMESHSLKLNATSTMRGGAWQLHSDEDQYPILKNEKYNHWSKYNDNLKNIVLEGDNLMDLQKFWNAMDTAFSSTLNANKGLEEYDKLTDTYSAIDILVPPLGHTQRNQGMMAYRNFTRVLRDHLLKKDTINKEVCPMAYKCLTKNKLEKDGFDILTRIILKGSPQLGGEERDLTIYVEGLAAQDGEELVEFYHRTKTMEYEISLQKDQTGQHQRLTRRFLQQLQKVPDYKLELGDISKGIRRFFQKPTWINDSIPFSIDDILDELENAEVKTTITIVDKLSDPIVNAGRVRREDVSKQQNRRPFLPKEEYLKQQRERRGQGNGMQRFCKDVTCAACGYTTKELYRLLRLHTGDPKQCLLRGPKYLNCKESRERLNQYNLKHKDDKRLEVSETRLEKAPQRPIFPKTNHVNADLIEGDESDKDEESQNEEYDHEEYDHEIDDFAEEISDNEDILPDPIVSSLKGCVEDPIINQGKTVKKAASSENMNRISSFRMKQE